MENDLTENFKKLVDYFGSQYKTAQSLGVKQSTVNGWVTGRHGCRAEIAMLAEKKTNKKLSAISLCPRLAKLETA